MKERPTWDDWRYRRHHVHAQESDHAMRLFGKPFARVGGQAAASLFPDHGHRTDYVYGPQPGFIVVRGPVPS